MAEGLNCPHSPEEGVGNNNNGQAQLPNGNGNGGGDGDGENMEVDQNVAAGDPVNNDDVGDAGGTEEERKITQTDHINKSLLTSFLSRLNDPATSSQFPSVQSTEFDEEEPVNH